MNVLYSPNGKQIASVCKSGTLLIWDPFNGRLLRDLIDHRKFTHCVDDYRIRAQ